MKPRSIVAVVLLLSSVPLWSECVQGEPNHVATLMVQDCKTTLALAEERLHGTTLRWVNVWVADVLERNPGIVVSGERVSKVHVTQHSDTDFEVLDEVPAEGTGEWFVASGDAGCESFPPGEPAEIYVTAKCCDVYPPDDLPCLLEVDQARPVPGPLRELLLR